MMNGWVVRVDELMEGRRCWMVDGKWWKAGGPGAKQS